MNSAPELKALLPLQCTKAFTKGVPTKQLYCYCYTCNCTPENGKTICEACAFACHRDHEVEYVGECPCVCQCPNCQALNPLASLKFEEDEVVIPALPSTIEYGKCTNLYTKSNFHFQHSYSCKTCNQKHGDGVCAICARICHSGHDLVDCGINVFYCDCETIKKPGFKCRCQTEPLPADFTTDLPFEIPYQCTSKFTKGKDYNQHGFACKTCHITEQNPICEVCARKCHQGHDLVDLRLVKFSTCGCCHGKADHSSCNALNDTEEFFVPSICAVPKPVICECMDEEEEEEAFESDDEHHYCGHHHCCHHHCHAHDHNDKVDS